MVDLLLEERSFDAVVVGTGPVESILASSLAVNGLKVLHIDENDYYGCDFVTAPLSQLLEIILQHPKDLCKYGDTRATSQFTVSTENTKDVSIINFTSTDMSHIQILDYSNSPIDALQIKKVGNSVNVYHPVCKNYLMERHTAANQNNNRYIAEDVNITHPVFFGYRANHENTKSRILFKDREFNLGFTNKLVFSSGKMVSTLINSGVSKYLEFKAIEALYYIENLPATNSSHPNIVAVPCSKGDVFTSKILSPLEKRSLMKFLQFVSDWSKQVDGKEVLTLNDTELSQGSSLLRPQNKNISKAHFDTSGFEERPFVDYLTHYGISKKLQDIITHVLCLDPVSVSVSVSPGNQVESFTRTLSPISTVNALTMMKSHLESLGQYGNTAFLAPLYGSCEISQAFCRLCAVWGGVYMLRASIAQIHVVQECQEQFPLSSISVDNVVDVSIVGVDPDGDGNTEVNEARGDLSESSHHLVQDLTATDVPPFAQLPCSKDLSTTSSSSTETVDPSSPSPAAAATSTSTPSGRNVISAVTLSSGDTFHCKHLICAHHCWPRALTKTVRSIRRTSVISKSLLPVGLGVLVIPALTLPPPPLTPAAETGERSSSSSSSNPYSIHVVQADSNLLVCPPGCFVLCLSTTIEATEEDDGAALMTNTIAYLQNAVDFEEYFFVTSLHPFFDPLEICKDTLASSLSNVYFTGEENQALHFDDAVIQAENIFHKICPGMSLFPEKKLSGESAESTDFDI